MREYSNTITLTKNIRGVYSLDTILGCSNVTNKNKNGELYTEQTTITPVSNGDIHYYFAIKVLVQ